MLYSIMMLSQTNVHISKFKMICFYFENVTYILNVLCGLKCFMELLELIIMILAS